MPAAPFFLNVLLTLAALVLGPKALEGAAGGSESQSESKPKVATA